MPLRGVEAPRADSDEALVASIPGRFGVVKDERLLGAFDSIEEALAAGAAAFGRQSFLVRKRGEKETEVKIPALTLGLLGADSQYSAGGSGS